MRKIATTHTGGANPKNNPNHNPTGHTALPYNNTKTNNNIGAPYVPRAPTGGRGAGRGGRGGRGRGEQQQQPRSHQPYQRESVNKTGPKFAQALDKPLFKDLPAGTYRDSLIPPALRDAIPGLTIRRTDIIDWPTARAAIETGACMLCLQGNHFPYHCYHKDKCEATRNLMWEYEERGKRQANRNQVGAIQPLPRPPAPRYDRGGAAPMDLDR